MPHRPGNIGHDVETEEKIKSLGARYATIVQFYVEKHNGDLEIQQVHQDRAVKLSQIPVIADSDRKLFWMPVDYEKANALTFEFPFGPKDIKYGANALEYSEVMRPSRKPLLRSKFPKNRTVAFTCVIADSESHGFLSCEDQLAILYSMAEQDKDLVFSHGGIALPFHVRMTGLTVTARYRNKTGLITQAKVSMNLKESVAIDQEIIFMTAVPHEPKVITAATNPGGEPDVGSWGSGSDDNPISNDAHANIPQLGLDSNIGTTKTPYTDPRDYFWLGDTSKLIGADGKSILPDNPRWSGGPLVSEGYHG